MIGEVCEVCGVGRREARRVRLLLDREERIVVIDNVPAEVCDHCGEQTFLPGTPDHIHALTHGGAEPVRTLAAPVYEYAEAAPEMAVSASARGTRGDL